jgi:hypothetical protein
MLSKEDKVELKIRLAKIETLLEELQSREGFRLDLGCGCCGGGFYLSHNGEEHEEYDIKNWRVE